jgi:putative toxin-antitoxin system antitoxin component (TIGR02293 family)
MMSHSPAKTAAKAPTRRAATSRPSAVAGAVKSDFIKGASIHYRGVYEADPIARVMSIKQGVPAIVVDTVAREMKVPKERLLGTLGIARATLDRKAKDNKPLSPEESSRVMGLARLVGQVEAIVRESGNPEGFSAPEWVATWLAQPLPALGGHAPGELMDTAEGQQIVSNLLERARSGAYA